MVSSGTHAFNPSVADLVLRAFLQCGVSRSQITQEHMINARTEANLLLAAWENVQPKLWEIDLYTFPTVAGTINYLMPPETILALDVYFTINGADRIMYPVSRTEYAAFPNKTQQGAPTVYWFNRQIRPEMNLYLAPNDVYSIKVYRVKQIEDANPTGAQAPDLARRFLPAFGAGLAANLSLIYAPDRHDKLNTIYDELFGQATIQDQENGDIQITPGLASYFR